MALWSKGGRGLVKWCRGEDAHLLLWTGSNPGPGATCKWTFMYMYFMYMYFPTLLVILDAQIMYMQLVTS